jgi:hypothetical protein
MNNNIKKGDQKMSYFSQISDGSFAEACYQDNSTDELIDALNEGADTDDCKLWGITPDEWRSQITLALRALIEDLQE